MSTPKESTTSLVAMVKLFLIDRTICTAFLTKRSFTDGLGTTIQFGYSFQDVAILLCLSFCSRQNVGGLRADPEPRLGIREKAQAWYDAAPASLWPKPA